MTVKFKRLCDRAVAPSKAHPSDAGFDLTAVDEHVIRAGNRCLIGTGISIDIPIGYCGLVTGRSGNTIKRGLVVQLGIIDSGYYGEVGLLAFNTTDEDIVVAKGERAGQLIIVPHLPVDFFESENFEAENRGGGFGSTGL